MHIGYIVLSHRDWPQVVKLTETLITLDPTATVVVSHDSADVEGTAALRKVNNIVLVSAQGGRGDFSSILRWNEAFSKLRERDHADYVMLISGQDYPIAHPDRIKSELASSGDGYMEYFPAFNIDELQWKQREARTRYYFTWRKLCPLPLRTAQGLRVLHSLNLIQPWLRLNVAYDALRLGIRSSGPPAPYHVYRGSQWHTLSWRAAEQVSMVIQQRPDVTDWARQSLVSDECFFQTVILNDTSLAVSQGSKRYYNFTNATFGHPKTLQLQDFNAILVSNAWFARKIDWVASHDLVEHIDRRILHM